MDDLFLLLFLVSFVCLVLSLKNPSIFNRFFKENISRKKLGLIFGGALFASFILFGIATDSENSETENQRRETVALEQTEIKGVAEESSIPPKEEIVLDDPDLQNVNLNEDSNETGIESDEIQKEQIVVDIQEEIHKVVNVVDGDTIKLDNGEVVRYIGIDTPETVHPSKPVQCFGKEASQKNEELVLNKEVRLVRDVSETDKYNRILRYVYVEDVFVNDYLVRNGFAKSSSYPPDVKHQDQFKEAEEEARNNKRGLWADDACKTEPEPEPIKTTPVVKTTPSDNSSYSCDCSKTCSRMSSCAEAQYQLNVCGCSRRDGDKDGIACDADCQ
jgi:micrococcal nuclease